MISYMSGMQKKHKLHLSRGIFQRRRQYLCDEYKSLGKWRKAITQIKKDFLNHPIKYLRLFLHMPSFALQQHKPFWFEFPFYSFFAMDVCVLINTSIHTSSLSGDYEQGQVLPISSLILGRKSIYSAFHWQRLGNRPICIEMPAH